MKIKRYGKGFFRYLRSTRAVSALEYAILVGVVVAGVGAAVTTFSNEITAMIGRMQAVVTGTTAPANPGQLGGTN